jgi:tRNA threonylcarbamoyladenosine biosynthesis protein TsaB
MIVILSIDTAIDTASISLSVDGELLGAANNNEQREHAAFVQPAIHQLLQQNSLSIRQIDAVAVVAGPGSYTGLRVGMASAKGLCYALNKPLITLSTLEIMAAGAIGLINDQAWDATLVCPMIDARRMEVFTALYDLDMNLLAGPFARTLNAFSFEKELLNSRVLFTGNGVAKWKPICNHHNASFSSLVSNTLAVNTLAYKKYKNKDFADLAYSEPFYLKEFFTQNPQK